MTYEQVMKDLRNEIDQRNVMISELKKDFEKLEFKSELVCFFFKISEPPVIFSCSYKTKNSIFQKNLYRRRPEAEHVDCGRVLTGDKASMKVIPSFHLLYFSPTSIRYREKIE